MRRLAIVGWTLTLACSPPSSEPTPSSAAAGPAATPAPTAGQPVSQDMVTPPTATTAPPVPSTTSAPPSPPVPPDMADPTSAAPSQPVPPDTATPPSTTPPVPPDIASPPSPFHVAARGDRWLTLRPLGDAVAVFDLELLAVAAPPTAPLAVQRARVPWTGVFVEPPGALGAAFSVEAVLGGRWPDAVMLTVNSADDRAYPEAEVLRLVGDAWRPVPLAASGGLRPFYADYAGWRDGATLALRLWATTEATSELETDRPADGSHRAALVRLDRGAGPRPPALPRDASLRIVRFAASPSGAISLLTDAGRLHRWTPDTGRWDAFTAPKVEERTTLDLLEGTDGAVWLSVCGADAPTLQRLAAGAWTTIEPPRPGCAASLALAGATLWAAFQGTRQPDGPDVPAALWRADTAGPLRWQPVALPPVVDRDRRHPRLSFEFDAWSIEPAPEDIPPDDRWPVHPDKVVAAGGAVWVAASWSGGAVALVDHPVAALVEPPRTGPRPASEPCSALFLSLGELPADAPPPPEVTAVIEKEGAGDVALVVAASDRARVLGLAWLPSLIDPADDIDDEDTINTARWQQARARLTKLGAATRAAWPPAAPTVGCWAPTGPRVVWAPERLPGR